MFWALPGPLQALLWGCRRGLSSADTASVSAALWSPRWRTSSPESRAIVFCALWEAKPMAWRPSPVWSVTWTVPFKLRAFAPL